MSALALAPAACYNYSRQSESRPAATMYFKQSAAPRIEMGMELDGERIEEYPDDPASWHPRGLGRRLTAA